EPAEVLTNKIRNILVRDVQSLPIVIKEDTSIYEAIVKMIVKMSPHLPGTSSQSLHRWTYLLLPIVIKEDTSIYEAIVKMFLEDVGTLYAIDDDRDLVGVISRKDLLKGTMGKNDIE